MLGGRVRTRRIRYGINERAIAFTRRRSLLGGFIDKHLATNDCTTQRFRLTLEVHISERGGGSSDSLADR